ncbi:proliferation marker protein Ki-67 [Urocitellus parryii]
MRPAGRLVTIKRSGADGAHFPLSLSSCLFGRGTECDIRIQLPVVSKQHCKIEIKEQKAILCNFSSTNPAQVNGSAIQEPVPLKHGDIITIIDRSFRYEDESRQNGSKSTESPGRTREQGPARRASRAGSSADPDGKEQDSKAHSKIMGRNAWGKPVECAKEITGDSPALDDADPEPPSARPSEHQGQDGRNAGDTSSGDSKAKPRVTLVSSHGTPRSVASAQCLDNSKRSESPFKKLYQSMKEELDANPAGQNVQCQRKSGAHSGGPAERGSTGSLQREPQLVLSCQPRRKSGRSPPMKEDPFPEPETGQTEKGSDLEPMEASKRLVGPGTPLSKMTREKAPVPCPQLPSFAQEHKNEDLRVTLSESAGVKAVDVTGPPGKLLIRNQAPVKAEGTANPNKKPENLSSRSRRSVPTNMEVLPTEIQSQPFLTQYLTQVEKKIQKDSFNKPEKLGTAAGQICSGLPGLSSVDISNFGDSINKSEDLSLKRRRVSFGGRLRPELFDENLPPNTPLKKGETPAKRKSLAAHSPAVLKKIIKEQPASLGTESSGVCWEVKAQSVSTGFLAASPRITAAGPGDERRRSGKASATSGGNKSPQDTPKKAGRKSGQLSSKRTSISRSQHGILQMICSKRRSGASEANLIVAKSWADVVKLGAKQTQTKVVKHGPQRQVNRRQRRPNTPKKPTGPVHHQFSTGHANSPCTIIIGKAQIEKVTAPARPYRMLNNLVFSQKMDYNEDLSGLTEMFKTPVKETTRRTTTSPSTLSSSEKSLGEKPQVTNSGGKPLPLTLEIPGSSVLSGTQKTAEPSETCFASPSLRRQSIRKDGNTEKAPRNISTMTHLEMRTRGFSPEPLKTVSSANKLRRSVELRNAEVPRVESKTEAGADAARALPGRRLRETPRGGQAGGREESAQSEGKGGRVTDGRRSRTGGLKSEPTASLTDPEKTLNVEPWEDPSGSQRLPRTPGGTQETVNEEEEATKLPCGTPLPSPATPTASGKRRRKRSLGKVDVQEEASALRKRAHLPTEATHSHAAPGGDEESTGVSRGTPEQKEDSVVYGTGVKRGPRTPKKKTQPLEDLAGFKELFQTPKHIEESMAADKTRLLVKLPEPGPVGTSTSTKTQVNTLQGRVDVKQECPAPERLRDTPREARHTGRASGAGGSAGRALEASAQQALLPAAKVTGSRRQPAAPREKAQPLEDLAGFQELFQTPGRGEDPKTTGETTDAPYKSTGPEPRGTPTPSKRRPRTSLQKVEKEELSVLSKLSQSPGRAMHTPAGPVQEEKGTRALGTPRQKLDLTDNLSGLKRQRRTPKEKAQPLEDLAGFQELFQTPGWDKDPKIAGETTDVLCESTGLELVNAPASTRRRSKTSVGKVEVKEETSVLREFTQMSQEVTQTPRGPGGDDKAIRALEEPAQQALRPAAKVTGSRRQPAAPREKAQPLEDLAGFQELFQTPGRGEDPKTTGETTDAPYKSTGPEPRGTPTPSKRRPRTSLQKVEKEELSVLSKLSQSPGRAMHTPTGPVQEEKGARALGTPRQKMDLTDNLSGLKRRRTPKEKAQPLEDLAGFQELFQTPGWDKDPKIAGETTDVLCESTGLELVNAPASTRRRSKTSVGKVEVKEETSVLREFTQMSQEVTQTPRGPGGDDKAIRALEEPAQQALRPAAKVTGSRRQPAAPREKAQPLEDLAGFQELFQTPGRGEDPKTTGETTDAPYKSTGPEPRGTPTPSKRRPRTSLQKVEKEELSVLSKLSQSPGRAMHTPTGPVQEEKGARALGTPRQKMDLTDNLSGLKRRRTPKEKAQPLEDLAGFQELFQTPGWDKDPKTPGETRDAPCKSAGSEGVRATASTKRRSKAGVGKLEEQEELSQSPGRAMHTPAGPVQEEKGTRALGTPRQKLDLTDNLSGLKRQRRTPKEKAQPLEDLAGFQELFQTPGWDKDLKTAGETTDAPCKTIEPEPRGTVTPSKSWPRTSLQNVEEKEELSPVIKPKQILGDAAHTEAEFTGDDKGVKMVKKPVKRKLDTTEKVTGSKRRRGAAEGEAQPPEDLAGSKDPISAPGPSEEPTRDEKTTETPCRSPQPEPGHTPASTKGRPRTRLRTAEVKEEPLAVRKPARTSRATRHTHTAPGGEDQGSRASEGSAQQARAPAARATGIRRLRGTAEGQPLEDLAGSKELIPAPGPTEGLAGEGKTTKIPCESPEAEPVATPAPPKRQPRAGLRKAPVTEEVSVQGEVAGTSGGPVHTHPEPKGDSKNINVLKEPVKRKLDPAAGTRGSKRRRGAAEGEAQPLEDMAGSKDPIPAPGPSEEPTRDEKTTETPCRSPQPEPGHTPASTKGRPRTRLRTAEVKEEPLAVRKPARTSRATRHTRTAPGGEDQGSRASEGSAQQALAPAARATGIRRLRGTAEGQAQALEDLAGSKELIQAPGPSEEPTRDEKTTETPSRSPQPEPGDTPANTKGRPRTRLRTAEVKEEPLAVRKPARTSRATRHTRTAPGGEDQGSRASEGSAQQARAPAARATGIRRLRGAPEDQPLEDLAGSKELIPAPGPTEGLQHDAQSRKSTPERTAERAKPLLRSSRVLRAPKGKPVGDREGKGHPTAPRSRSNMSLPTGQSGADGLLAGVGAPCSETGLQDTVQAKAVHGKKRAAPRKRGRSPEPLIINKDLKILINRIEPVEDHNSSREAGKRKLKVEDSAPADKGILLRTRHQNTTEGEEPRPEITVSAEKMRIKREGKKPTEPSQEVGLQGPGDGDEKAESRAKVRGKRAGIGNQISQPHTAEEEVTQRSVGVPMKNQEEKGAAANSDFRCLRSRKPGMQPSLESESEQRVTRGAKRCAENLKVKDTVDTKKLRSRSHRHREDI